MDGMAQHAASAQEELAAAARRGFLGVGRGLALRFSPGFELVRRQRDHFESHERMLQSAVLGAWAVIFAGLVGAKLDRGGAAGDEVLLAMQAGYPEAVDHVVGIERDEDRPADRNTQLVRGREHTLGLRIVVGDFPPPLMGPDADVERIGEREPRQLAIGRHTRHQ